MEPTPEARAFADWRLGVFVHFGMSTFTGDEYGKSGGDSRLYAPESPSPAQWVEAAQAIDARYMVLTAKHCHGHCLWPSEWTDYSVTTSSNPIDVAGEFVSAARAGGIVPCLYYLLGWDARHQPKMTPPEYEAFVLRQLTELLRNYGPLGMLWLDIPFDLGPDTAGVLQRIYQMVKEEQSDCLVLLNQSFHPGTGPRLAEPTWFYEPCGAEPIPLWPTDVLNGEMTLPPESGHNPLVERKWVPMEVCWSIAEHWFWVDADPLHEAAFINQMITQAWSRGANFLLNLPPDRTGLIPEATIRRAVEGVPRQPTL